MLVLTGYFYNEIQLPLTVFLNLSLRNLNIKLKKFQTDYINKEDIDLVQMK